MDKKTLITILSALVALGAWAQNPTERKAVAQTSVKPAEVVVNKDRLEHPFDGCMDGQKVDGYRGIWFTIGQAKSDYGDKYSGGLGTYTMKHIPMAVYSKEADKTFFVYGGAPDTGEKYLLCMIGCYDHKTGMLSKPVVVHDKGCYGVYDPHDDPTVQIDKDGYVWVFVAGRANKRPGIRYRSVKPYDISAFEYVNESIMAYPEVIYDKEKGFFLFDTRYDGVRRTFFQTSKDGVNWSDFQPIASIIEPGEEKSGHYQFANYDGEKLVCCFNRHINAFCKHRLRCCRNRGTRYFSCQGCRRPRKHRNHRCSSAAFWRTRGCAGCCGSMSCNASRSFRR